MVGLMEQHSCRLRYGEVTCQTSSHVDRLLWLSAAYGPIVGKYLPTEYGQTLALLTDDPNLNNYTYTHVRPSLT